MRLIIYLISSNISKVLSKLVVNIKIVNEIFYILLVLNLQNPVFSLHLQHILIQTSHLSRAQYPHVASGCCTEWRKYSQSDMSDWYILKSHAYPHGHLSPSPSLMELLECTHPSLGPLVHLEL